MSLIVSQTPANRLPAELVNNAALVKQVDFDPVHQTAETSQPAEKIHGSALPRFDSVSISAESVAPVETASEEQVGDMTAFTSFERSSAKLPKSTAIPFGSTTPRSMRKT